MTYNVVDELHVHPLPEPRAVRRARPPRRRHDVLKLRKYLAAADRMTDAQGTSIASSAMFDEARAVLRGHDRTVERRRAKRKAAKRARRATR